jgi:hypothetical protein
MQSVKSRSVSQLGIRKERDAERYGRFSPHPTTSLRIIPQPKTHRSSDKNHELPKTSRHQCLVASKDRWFTNEPKKHGCHERLRQGTKNDEHLSFATAKLMPPCGCLAHRISAHRMVAYPTGPEPKLKKNQLQSKFRWLLTTLRSGVHDPAYR